jgi:hypothetical protein
MYMSNPIDVTGVQRQRPRVLTGQEPQADTSVQERIEQAAQAAASTYHPDQLAAQPGPVPDATVSHAVNPYAPTGWKSKGRAEFDLELPSGQLCRIMRLEREDLFRMNLLQYLDTFTPLLLDADTSSESRRDDKIKEQLKDNPNALSNMFMAIDEVVMAACIKPRITNQREKADYGGPADWQNPRFVPVAYIDDIDMDDRMAIFGGAFGKSMDDLKSLWKQTPSMGSLADVTGIQQTAE